MPKHDEKKDVTFNISENIVTEMFGITCALSIPNGQLDIFELSNK